jgi:hypothetical protein
MSSKGKMVLAWVAILALVVGVCAQYGGRNCEVPKSGPFHWLLKGRHYVPRTAGRYACSQVK